MSSFKSKLSDIQINFSLRICFSISVAFYALKRANTYYPRHIKIFPYELGFNFNSGFHRLHRLQEQVQDFSFGLEKFISLFYEIKE